MISMIVVCVAWSVLLQSKWYSYGMHITLHLLTATIMLWYVPNRDCPISNEVYTLQVVNVYVFQAGQAAFVSLTTTQTVLILIATQLRLTISVQEWFDGADKDDDAVASGLFGNDHKKEEQGAQIWAIFFHNTISILFMICLAALLS